MIIQKYDSYKDLGIEWLGEIPEGWEVKRGKDLFKLSNFPAKKGHNLQLLSVYSSIGVRPRKDLEQRGNKASNTDEYWVVKKNDIIINKLLAWMGGIGLSKYDGVTSPAYDILRKRLPLNERFYELFFRLKKAQIEFKRHSRGILEIRLRLYNDRFGQISFPYPSKKEQDSIIFVLDKTLFKINKKIRLLQDKISTIEEFKKVLINESVCRGLNKNVELKDSGIQWMGKIPKNWEIKRLKDRFTLMSSGIKIFEGFKQYLSTKSISNNRIEEAEGAITYDNRPDRANMQPEINSVWFAKLRFTNKSYLFDQDEEVRKYILSTGFAGLLCNKVYNKFAYYYISSDYFLYQKDLSSYGTTQEGITEPNIQSIIFLNPPKTEQLQIAKYLDEKTSKIDEIIKKINDQIATLIEFRKTLINDVVTGKVRIKDE